MIEKIKEWFEKAGWEVLPTYENIEYHKYKPTHSLIQFNSNEVIIGYYDLDADEVITHRYGADYTPNFFHQLLESLVDRNDPAKFNWSVNELNHVIMSYYILFSRWFNVPKDEYNSKEYSWPKTIRKINRKPRGCHADMIYGNPEGNVNKIHSYGTSVLYFDFDTKELLLYVSHDLGADINGLIGHIFSIRYKGVYFKMGTGRIDRDLMDEDLACFYSEMDDLVD